MSYHSLRRHSEGLLTLSGLGAVWLLASPVAAQPTPDQARTYLNQVKSQNEVAAQKTEADVRLAVREAQRLSATDSAKAVERLKKVLDLLEDDTTLAPARRDALVRMIKDRIRVAEAPPEPVVDKTDKRLDDLDRKNEQDRQAGDQEKLKQSLETVNQLKKDGKVTEANRQANDLNHRYPEVPAIQGTTQSLSTADQLSQYRQLKREREQHYVASMRDVDRSALPPIGDIDFGDPAHWKKITELRKKYLTQVTGKERAILQALNSPITVRFKDSRFEDVIEALATFTGQPIILDQNALKDAGVGYDTPVTVQVKGVAVRTLLRKVLSEFNLTYVVKDETVQITTTEKARGMMTVRSYSIADLVSNVGAFGGTNGLLFGPGVSQLQLMQNVGQIIDMIQSSVDPQSWSNNGGQGSIVFHPATMSLIIKQTAEVHSMLGSGMLP